MSQNLSRLLQNISNCTLCECELPLGAHPVVRASRSAKILIAGQAPGLAVHQTGIPFNDPSGHRLRSWMGMDDSQFYDDSLCAIIPMGFCYPGRGKNGDLPPLPLCSQTWHHRLLAELKHIELILPIGQYAHRFYLGSHRKRNLTETVRHWQEYSPQLIPLPHPSPRNNIWLKKNPWFAESVLPELQARIRSIVTKATL